MQKYEVIGFLGQGNFAKVYHARNLQSGQIVAIKVIDKEQVFKGGMMEQTKREIQSMRMVQHPNVLQFYEVMASKTNIYFVMEYAEGGELFNRVANGKLKEDVARKYFQQLTSAVDFCHRRGVYHRDLKPENLLLDENGNLKVSDFGLSALTETKHQDGLLHTTCGTPAYIAPEVLNRRGYCGAKADVWSCGVILFVLLAGYLPFHDSNLRAMYRKISRAQYVFPRWFSKDVRRLLSRILDPNPYYRIATGKIMENPWFKRGFNSRFMGISNTDAADEIAEAKQDMVKPTNLNAFDIISLSSGLDLSGLFSDAKEEVKFTSTHPVSTIMDKLEEIAGNLRLNVKKGGKLMKLERSDQGRTRELSIDAEIFEFTPSFYLVEMRKTCGDTLEYHEMLQQHVRPALHDIAWAWAR